MLIRLRVLMSNHAYTKMMRECESVPLSHFPAIASKNSTLSDADISLVADDGKSSRLPKDEKDLLYSDDERKLKKQKLLIGLNLKNSHLQNPTDDDALLPNSQTGSRQNINDVFLVCSNAIYNSPDTIYNRQAQAMQEITRKDLAEFSPIFAITESVISHFFPRKAKDKEEEEITHNSPEDASHPVTLDGITVLTLAVISCSIVVARFFRNFCQWLDTRLQSPKLDVAVTTIAPQVGLIPSHRPIFFSKYSRSAGVPGLKGIRYIRKAETVFRQKVEQHQEGTSL